MAIELTLENFRCHAKTSLRLDQSMIFLLKGPSGTGKTTILAAIEWCLYGTSSKQTVVYPSGRKGVKTKVGLRIGKFLFCRTRGPNDFRIFEEEKPEPLIEEAAESFVLEKFGTLGFWRSCAYLSQGNLHPLLTGTPMERLVLVEELSFSTENPTVFIERLDSELIQIKTRKKEMETKLSVLSSEAERFSFSLEVLDEFPNSSPSEEISKLEKKKEKLCLKERVKKHEIALDKTGRLEKELKGVQEKHDKIVKELNEICPNFSFSSSQVSDFLFFAEKQEEIQHQEALLRLEGKLKDEDGIMDFVSRISDFGRQKFLTELAKKEAIFSAYKQRLDKIGFKDFSSVKQRKKELEERKAMALESKIEEECEALEKQIKGLPQERKEVFLSKVSPNFLSLPTPTRKEVQETIVKEKLYESFLNDLSSLGFSNSEELENFIREVSRIEESKQNFSKRQELESIRKKLSNFSFLETTSSEKLNEELAQITRELKDLLSRKVAKHCPNCKVELRIEGRESEIVLAEERNFLPSSEVKKRLKETETRKKEVEERIKLFFQQEAERKVLLLEEAKLKPFEGVEDPGITEEEFQTVRGIRDKAKRFSGSSFSSFQLPKQSSAELEDLISKKETFQKILERDQLEQKLASFLPKRPKEITIFAENEEKELKTISSFLDHYNSPPEFIPYITDHVICAIRKLDRRREIDYLRSNVKDAFQPPKALQFLRRDVWVEIDKLAKTKEVVLNNLSLLSSSLEEERKKLDFESISELESLESSISTFRKKEPVWEKAKIGKGILGQKGKIEELLASTNKELENALNLKIILVEERYRQMEETVGSINSSLAVLSEDLFEDPIRIELLLKKEVESTGNNKPSVEIEIEYHNSLYKKVEQLSGGERARLSFLLLLACFLRSDLPLLIVDEGTAYLDGELRTACIDLVRSVISKRKETTSIFVQHEGVDGEFDRIIDITTI